jgi:hypothetical protein
MPAVPLGPVLCQNVFCFSILNRHDVRSSPVSFRPVAERLGPKWIQGAAPRLLPLRPGHDHIGLPSAAAGTEEPLAPVEDAGVAAVTLRHLCRVGLYLMLARLAPHDKPDLGRGGYAERHRRAAL